MKEINELRREAHVLRLLYTFLRGGLERDDALRIMVQSHDLPEAGYAQIHEKPLPEGASPFFSDFIVPFFRYGTETDRLFNHGLWKATYLLDDALRLTLSEILPYETGRVLFTRIAETLINQGCPILEALTLAGNEYLPPDRVTKLIKAIRKGKTIAKALRTNREYFDKTDYVFWHAAEQTGMLPELPDGLYERLAQIHETHILTSIIDLVDLSPHISEAAEIAITEWTILAALTSGFLSPAASFKFLSNNAPNLKRRKVFKSLVDQYNSGKKLSEVIRGLPPGSFDYFIQPMVNVAETNGNLEVTFKLISEYYAWEFLGVRPASEYPQS